MRYVSAALRWESVGEPRHSRACCARMVWPTERFVHPPSSCGALLSQEEMEAEAVVDTQLQAARKEKRDEKKAKRSRSAESKRAGGGASSKLISQPSDAQQLHLAGRGGAAGAHGGRGRGRRGRARWAA